MKAIAAFLEAMSNYRYQQHYTPPAECGCTLGGVTKELCREFEALRQRVEELEQELESVKGWKRRVQDKARECRG